ncbi:MAG: ExbD/TolR family protein, partial [Planctomycetota bacterium]
ARRGPRFSLRMAPMIDVIFLLLIFFLVAAKWRPEENFLPFKLPVAQARDGRLGKPEPLVVQISTTDAGCEVQIAGLYMVQIENENLEVDLAALMENLRDCMLRQKRYTSDPIEIVCEPTVKSDYWIKIYNLFFGAGLTDITFAMTQ